MSKKIFKFWKWRIELKLSKMANKNKVEFLANQLIKELGIKCNSDCELTQIWIHDKKDMMIQNSDYEIEIKCKYTGK